MKKLFIAIAALCIGLSAHAQQALWGGPSVESPVINPDGTVTFPAIEFTERHIGKEFDYTMVEVKGSDALLTRHMARDDVQVDVVEGFVPAGSGLAYENL